MIGAATEIQERNRIREIASGVQVGMGTRSFGPGDPPGTGPQHTALATFMDAMLTRHREYMYRFHAQWFENIASVVGAGNSSVSHRVARATGITPRRAPRPSTKHRTNLIGPNCRMLVGYLSRSNPDINFTPADLHDPLQVDYAQGARRFLEQNFRQTRYQEKILEVLEWSVYTGWGILKAVFDPTGGPRKAAVDDFGQPLMDPKTNKPLVNRRGMPLFYSTGMPDTRVVSPFNYFYNTNARDDDEVFVRGEHGWRSFAEQERWSPGSVDEMRLTNESQYGNVDTPHQTQVQQIGPGGAYTGLNPDSELQGCHVTSVYIAPHVLDPRFFDGLEDPKTGEKFDGDEVYSQGLFLEVAQNRVLECRANPLMELEGVLPRRDWHPYTEFPCYTVTGRKVPQGIPDNMRPLEDALNFHLGRIRDGARLMGQPKWFIPKGTGITNAMLTNEAGEKVWYNPAVGEPKSWSPPPMPAYLFGLMDMFTAHADRVGSSPPMMRGESSGQLRSGYAVAQMQDAALSQYTPMVTRQSLAKANHARQLVLRAIQFLDEPLNVQFEVGNGDWEQEEFLASGMAPDFHVIVVPSSIMPRSEAAEMSKVDRMVAWGALNPMASQEDRQYIAKVMELELPAGFTGNMRENIRQARYENVMLMEGRPTVTHPVYNHEVHINEHIAFMNSQRFRELAEKDPQMAARFYEHIGMHQGFIQIQQSGVSMPQPIPPVDQIQESMGQAAAPVLGALQGSSQGGGGGAGPPNRGPVSTGTGTQLGTARAGGAQNQQVGSMPSIGALENM